MKGTTMKNGKRKTQYVTGFDDAIESAQQLCALAIEAYPRVPSVESLGLFMDPELALTLLDIIPRLHKRIVDDLEGRLGAPPKPLE